MHSGSCSQMTSSRKCPILWRQSLKLYFCHSVSGVFLGPTGRTILWYQSLLRTNLFFQLWQRLAYLFDISWIIETNLLVADWWRYFMYLYTFDEHELLQEEKYLNSCLQFYNRPVSQSCAVGEQFWRATGQSNLAYKRLAATKASTVWVFLLTQLHCGQWSSVLFWNASPCEN